MKKTASLPKNLSISSADILSQIGEAVVAADFQGKVLFWNAAAERQYDFSADQMMGQPLSQAYRLEWLEGVDEETVKRSLQDEGRWFGECIQVLANGRRLYVEVDAYLLRSEGEDIGSVGVIRDISAKRLRELDRFAAVERSREEAQRLWVQLRDSRGVLENFLENLPVAAYVKDHRGRFIFLNQPAKEIDPAMTVGLGRTVEELFGIEASRQYLDNDSAVLASGRAIRTVETITVEGTERSFVTVKFPIADASGELFLGGVSVDITESIRDQAELRRQAMLLNSVNDAIFVSDLNGIITYWNRGAERLYRWSAEEALGQDEIQLLKARFPLPDQEMMELLLREGHWEGEVVRHDRDGAPIPVKSRWSVLRDLAGNPVGRIVINTDLTSVKHAVQERRRTEAEAQAYAAELSNLLKALPGDAPAGSDTGSTLSNLPGETSTQYDKSGQFGEWPIDRPANWELRATPILVNEIMDATLEQFGTRIRELGVTIEREYRTSDRLRCYSGDLNRVFAAFLSNALDAMPNGGKIRIRTHAGRSWMSGASGGRRTDTAEAGICLLIADTGCGVPFPIRKRLFDPFISTKEAAGAGLGLWVAECILRKYAAKVKIRSSQSPTSHGTAFSLFFPLGGIGPSN